MILGLLAPLAAYALPPATYRNDKTVLVTFAKPGLVTELCGQHGEPGVIGCAYRDAMIVPNPCAFTDQSYAAALCHELGHINGWSANHEAIP